MMDDAKRLMNIYFFHLSLYYKVSHNHVSITINITRLEPQIGKVQYSEYLDKVEVFKQAESNGLHPPVLIELNESLKVIRAYL